MSGEREYDLVLFGATGFTGGLTADYLAAHGPPNLRWALAGRSRGKLEAVAARLAAARSSVPPPALLEADAADAPALARIAGPPPGGTPPGASVFCAPRGSPGAGRGEGRAAPASSTAAASTRSRMTSAPTSRSSS